MLRQLPLALALGLSSAVLYAAALSGSPIGIFLAYLAVLPLFAVGLSMGLAPLAVAAASAAVGIAAFGGLMPGLLYGLSHALPAVVLVVLALRSVTWSDGQVYWYPPGRLVQALALWGVGVVVLLGLGLSLFGAGFESSVVAFIEAMADAFQSQGQPILNADAAAGVAVLLPGIVAWSWMVMVTLNGLAAQGVLRRSGRALRPSPRLAEVVVGPAWVAGFGVCAIAGVAIPGDLGFGAVNLAIILAFPLFFQGLSVVHTLLAHWRIGTLGVGLFYVLMVLLSWTALAVVALGLAEPLVRLRARLAGPQNT
jgi:hypothetical protein